MDGIQPKITRFAKKQESMSHNEEEKNLSEPTLTDPDVEISSRGH